MSCYFVFKIWYWYRVYGKKDISIFGPQKFNPLIWAIPAMCDVLGTSSLFVALTWTYVASLQMLSGSVIIFTGLLSVAFLGSRLKLHNWIGIIIVVVALMVVGVGDYIYFNDSMEKHLQKETVLSGDLLIVLALIIISIQVTFEEMVIKKYQVPPLQGAGWEGIFGFTTLLFLLIPMYYTPWHLPATQDFWQDTTRYEDALDGLCQIGYSPYLLGASFLLVFGSSLFTFTSLTITKRMSATTRMVLDNMRTLFVWIFGLLAGWQQFQPFQILGYVLLLIGTCIYSDFISMPFFHWIKRKYIHWRIQDIQEKKPLINRWYMHVPAAAISACT